MERMTHMNILVIHGSMRKGNTYALTKEIVDRLAAKPDVNITEIGVEEMDLPFCTSCHACLTRGEEHCPHDDRLQKLRTALNDCDGLILSGTTYVRALNAAMKNVIDHFAYMFHRPALFGKQGMVIATSAGVGEKNVAKYIKNVMGQWGINGAIIVTRNTKEERLQSVGGKLPQKVIRKYDTAAQKFYDRMSSKRVVSPAINNIIVHNAFRATSLSEYSESLHDTQHWSMPGFADRAYPVKINAFKYMFGTIMYNIIKKATAAIGRSYEKKQKGNDSTVV